MTMGGMGFIPEHLLMMMMMILLCDKDYKMKLTLQSADAKKTLRLIC